MPAAVVRFHSDDLLIAVVDRPVVPRLDQQVETYTTRAILHNPITAETIDGEAAGAGSVLTPDVVEIPITEIVEFARGPSEKQENPR